MPIMIHIRRALVVCAVLAAALTNPAAAQAGRAQRGFRAELAPAQEAGSIRMRRFYEESGMMTEFAAHLNHWVNMPRPVTLRWLECPASDVRWVPETQSVEMCYRMLNRVTGLLNGNESAARAAMGAHFFAIFHAVAHAMVDELDLPTPNGEEQAVDELMALLLIHQGPEYGTLMVGGMKALHAADAAWAQWAYATAHGLGPERFETIACLAYGANPRYFGAYREQGLVSAERAPRCAAAYQRVFSGMGQRLSRHMARN
jgi:hypothetical protein